MSDTSWLKDAIIYQILIDRFAGFKSNESDKPIFIGGNINGIINKLSYIKDLGINTIWLSPFYKTTEYHGYHITDFMQVEPRFGTLDDLKRLITMCHQMDLRIISDFIPNHCSNKHPFFQEAIKSRDSRYHNWFYFNKWPDNYHCFLKNKDLPKLNLQNIKTRDYICNTANYWLSQGIDGFRLDHVIGLKHSFLKHLKKITKNKYTDSVLIGEAWLGGINLEIIKTINIKHKIIRWLFGTSQDNIQKDYYNVLDGILDFKFQQIMKEYIAHSDIFNNSLQEELNTHFSKYPDDYYVVTFLDNHDMNRFLFDCNNNIEKLKIAAKIQFKLCHPLIIYYGTEVGMTQNKSVWERRPHADIEVRQPMNWDNQDKELLVFYKNLIKGHSQCLL